MGCNYDGNDWPNEEKFCKYKKGMVCEMLGCVTTCAYHPYNFTNKSENDVVHRPAHYANKQIEVIDYIKDTLTPEQYQGYCLGNVIKYISRYQKKNGREYLKKAAVYLRWLTESMEETK